MRFWSSVELCFVLLNILVYPTSVNQIPNKFDYGLVENSFGIKVELEFSFNQPIHLADFVCNCMNSCRT